jgi:hypothetical protein
LFRNYAWFVRGQHHKSLCLTSMESVKKADRYARCYVATDDPDIGSFPEGVIRVGIDPGMPIMLANIDAQIRIRHLVQDEDVYFLDTDTLLVKPFDVPPCDIAFTWRDSIGLDEDGEKVEGIAQRMPYNYGVMVAAPTIGAIESLIWLRERVRVMHASSQQWYGNQLAAAELAGPRPDAGTEVVSRRIPWRFTMMGRQIRVAKMPCEAFNYTPQKADENVSAKYVLHFKGGKRALMEGYARAMGLTWHVLEKAA